MEPRHVDLPEPASRIWKHATRLVDALLKECKTLEHQRWYLGEGTALSADWRHRESTDIDILIAPGLSMAALHGEGYERLGELIDATGGTRIDAPDQKLSVTYGKDGKIDIFSSGRQLPGHEQPIEVAGRAALRLSNAQIFAGKFRRAIDHNVAARDLFDICYAARIKDAGMQQALNALTLPELQRVHEFWETSSTKIEQEARERLSGIARENWIDPSQLVEQTVRTTEDHRYAQVFIRAGNDQTRIRTITNSGRTDEYRSASADIERDFHALGISRHLMCHNINPNELIHDARGAMTQSVEQTVAQTARTDGPERGARAQATERMPVFRKGHVNPTPPKAPPPADAASQNNSMSRSSQDQDR